MTPPRLARALLRTLLPARHAPAVISDLDEEFARFIQPTRSRLRAAAWYWRQALISIPPAWRPRHAALAGTAADVRFGLRLWRRRPLLAAAAILTLAGGIAVATASLSLADAVLLRELPLTAPHRLVGVAEFDTRRESSSGNVSWPDFLDYQAQATSLSAVAGHTGGSRTLTGRGPADRLTIAEVTTNFFDTLGVRPALGRGFRDADGIAGGDGGNDAGAAGSVALVGEASWRTRFGADPAIVGRTLRLSGQPVTVIGVLPPDFLFPPRASVEIWMPIRPSPAQRQRRFFHWLDIVARLAPEATIEDARADLRRVARSLAAVDPEFHPAADVRVQPLADVVVGSVRPLLVVVLCASAMVLLLACANVAGVLVARSSARRRELEVRSALGAGRWRLARQLALESLIVGGPAVVLGVLAAYGLLVRFVGMIPAGQRLALPHLAAPALEPRIALGIAAFTLVAVGLAGLSPVRLRRGAGHDAALRAGVGGTRRDVRVQAALLTLQVAAAVVLLSGAGLMAQSVRRLAAVSPGFDTERLLTMRLTFAGPRYQDPPTMAVLHAELLDRIERVPGVLGAATIDQLPLTGPGGTGTFQVRGRTDDPFRTLVRTTSHRYFEVMGVPLLAGRAFDDRDRLGASRTVIVNRRLEALAFGGRAVGQAISFPVVTGQPFFEIVGVVGDEQFDRLDRDVSPVVYLPYGQLPGNGFGVTVRTVGEPLAVLPALRAAVAEFDADAPVFGVRAMSDLAASSPAVSQRRAVLGLVGVFAIAALSLSAVGLFTAVAQAVTRRSREIGLRLALGASRRDILGPVVGRSLLPALAGLALGLGGSAVFALALSTLLFGVAPSDPATVGGVAALLIATAAAACVAPARRALQVDPADVLRSD